MLTSEERTQENRWQADVATAGIFWFLLAMTTWYKKCFLGAAGAQHAQPRPGLQNSQCRIRINVHCLFTGLKCLMNLTLYSYTFQGGQRQDRS